MIKQFYTNNKKSGILRSNYLLISIFEEMLDYELPSVVEEV